MRDNPNLLNEILADPEEMEWLIFNGVTAYEKMAKNNGDFKARIGSKKARELLGKHTDPIPYILPKLVEYSDDVIKGVNYSTFKTVIIINIIIYYSLVLF